MDSTLLTSPYSLPCGVELKNKMIKAAMTEGLATAKGHATESHATLYRRWAEGGASVLLTGNIMVDGRYLERAGNVVAEDESGLSALTHWAEACHDGGALLWGQISHPGRQCPRMVNAKPISPSNVQLNMIANFGKPKAATEDDIQEIIQRFATTANILKKAGFDGVQIHSAHGYFLSQFLSPITNKRTDQWGGSLENRARLLLSVVKAVRDAVGDQFPVSVKLNSADFQKGGFTLQESVQVVTWLNELNIDLLEVSGGTYEQLEFFKQDSDEVRESTRKREAYFLEYAQSIKKMATMPIMVTGGFRSKQGMESALQANHTDLIGLGRPFCTNPDFPLQFIQNTLTELPVHEEKLVLGSGYFGPNSSSKSMQALNNQSQAGWYYGQIERLADGQQPDENLSPRKALLAHLKNDMTRSIRRKVFG